MELVDRCRNGQGELMIQISPPPVNDSEGRLLLSDVILNFQTVSRANWHFSDPVWILPLGVCACV